MKIIIHVGMHKTGSSSIQHTFARLKHPDIAYIDWGASGNHSGLFVLLFEDLEKLPDHHSYRARGPEIAQKLPTMRDEAHANVSRQLANAADKTVIFSAEAISSPPFENAVQRLHNFVADWTNDISIIGYAHPPASVIPSAFQQILKTGNVARLANGGAAPHYRARFQRIDRIFGRNRVYLKEFTKGSLIDGDVVQDFSNLVGLGQVEEDQIVRANESLSLEAGALLYVQRKLGQGFVAGFNDANRANSAFTDRLATIGHRKFAFSSKMLAPILERDRDDIAWMEARLGHPFSDSGTDHKDAIDSLDDLVDIALGQFDAVQELLGEKAVEGPATTESLVQALERLREQCYAQVLHTNAGHAATGEARPLTETGIATMATKTDRLDPTEEDLRLRRILARLLWNSDHKDDMPSDPAERKAAFDLVRRDYQKKALDLTRRLENNNLKLVETDKQS